MTEHGKDLNRVESIEKSEGSESRSRWVSAKLQVSVLIGTLAVMVLAILVLNHLFDHRASLETCAVAATSCDASAPPIEVTLSLDYVPLAGSVAGELTAESPQSTKVFVRQNGMPVAATLKIIGDDYGVRPVSFAADDPNDPDIIGLVHNGSRSGRITLRVEDPNDAEVYDELELNVGSGCTSCGGGCIPGKITIEPDGVDVRFAMGKLDRYDTAGDLRIRSDGPCAKLSSPAGLMYYLENDNVEVIRDGSDNLRQVLAPQALADIVVIGPTEYEIRFYAAEDAGVQDPNTGLYAPDPNDLTYKWVIESTDGAPNYHELQISKMVEASTSVVYKYTYSLPQGADRQWSLTSGDGADPNDVLRTETVTWVDNDPNDIESDWTRTIVVEQDGGTYAKTIETHSVFDWGKAVTHHAVMLESSGNPQDPNDALITAQGYYDSGVNTKGRLKWSDNADGAWSYYTYESDGRIASLTSGWEDYHVDLSSQAPAAGSAHVLDYTYETDPNAPIIPDGPINITERIEGVAVASTDYDYAADPNSADLVVQVKRCVNPTVEAGSRAYLTTTTTYEGDEIRRPLEIVYPDDRVAAYSYDDGGTFTRSISPASAAFDPNTPGADDRVTITWGTVNSPGGAANKTTRQVSVTDALGLNVLDETYVCVTAGSAYERIGWTVTDHDELGRVTDVYQSNNTHIHNEWSDCCGLASSTDGMNITTSYGRDSLQRITSATKEGVAARTDPNCPAQDDVTTTYEYESGSDLRTVTTTVSDEHSHALESVSISDLAGRIVSQIDAADLETEYAYDFTAQGGRKVTITQPNGGTNITEYYRDGRIKKVYGTAVIASFYEYDKEADGDQTTKVYTGSSDNTSSRWAKTTSDPLGRTKLEEKPAFVVSGGSANSVFTTYTYNATTGKLAGKQIFDNTADLQAATLYEYEADTGDLVRSGLDLNDDGDLDLGGTDRINETETQFTKISNDWWQETKTYVYLTNNSSTRTRTNWKRSRLTGFGANVIAEAENLDDYSNVTKITTSLDPNDPTVTVTTDYPAADNNAVRVTRNGSLQSEMDRAQITTSYTYDGLRRRTGVTDGRGNTTVTAYKTTGQVDYVEDASGNRTTYYYYGSTSADAGRIEKIANDDSKYTYYDYDLFGHTTHVWGDVPHPASYGYDATFGQRITTSTYRGGTGWSASTWPASPGTADTTTFTFDDATGLLIEQENAANKSVTFTYTPDGKIAERTWARDIAGSEDPLTTTYEYSDGSTGSGDLVGIDYADGTPDVTFSHTRSGKHYQVADAVGTRTFTYDARNNPLYEDFASGGLLGSRRISNDYDYTVGYGEPEGDPPTQPVFQFVGLTQIGVGTSGTPYQDYRVEYVFDNETGRIEAVQRHVVTNDGVNVAYRADARLIDHLDYMSGVNVLASVHYTYETDRDLIAQVKNIWGDDPDDPNGVVSKYTYAHDNLGLTASVIRQGYSAFGAFGTDHNDQFTYNDRGELLTSRRYNNTIPDTSNPDAAYDRIAELDAAGNWQAFQTGAEASVPYETSALNQYESINDPNDPNTPVETFTYDDDGNLIEDGSFKYSYDAENRLIEIVPAEDDPNNLTADDKKLVFAYDYLNRRVRKTVYAWDPNSGENGAWSATASLDRLFVYHGRMLLLELDNLDNKAGERKYVYGPGTDGKLGGENSLLAVNDGATATNYVCFNDGTGSVGQLVDRADGSIDAKYVYDIRGQALRCSGIFAVSNSLRFEGWHFTDELNYGATECEGVYFTHNHYCYLPRIGRTLNGVEYAGTFHHRLTKNINDIYPYNKYDHIYNSNTPSIRSYCNQHITFSYNAYTHNNSLDNWLSQNESSIPNACSATCCGDFFSAYHVDGLGGEYFRSQFCRDCGIGGWMHPGQICYRAITCGASGCHVCFARGANGSPEIHTSSCSSHVDSASPACGSDSNGCCIYGFVPTIEHLVIDVVGPVIIDILNDLEELIL